MSKARNYNILRASGAGLVQRLVQLLSSLITLPVALHSLGIAGFGIWGAATSLAWLSGLLTFGFGSALVTLIPRGLATGQTAENRGYVSAALYGGTALASILLFGGMVACLFGIPIPSAPFLVAAIALIVNIPLSVSFELWLALQKGHIAAYWATVQTLLGLFFVVIGGLTGMGVTIMVAAVYGAIIIANACSLVQVLWVHHHVRPYRHLPPAAMRTVLGHGGMLFAITVTASCSTAFDNVVALAWLGPAASAQMAVATRVCIMATAMVGAITQPFWPSFADAFANNDLAWARRMLFAGAGAVLLLSMGGSGLIIIFGNTVLRWWLHQDLHFSILLLWAMAAWITGMTLTYVPGLLLNAALKLRVQVLILSTVALTGIGLKYVASRHFGIVGILFVTPALWVVPVSPLYFWLAWRVVTKPV